MIERERERGEERKEKKKGTSTNVILVDVIHAYDISNKDDEGEEFEVKRNGRVTVLTVNARELHVSLKK